LIGDTNANVLDGGDGNDLLQGGGGDDDIIGGAGTLDTAFFAGSYASATIAEGAGATVTVTTGTDGTDTLTGIEILRFGNPYWGGSQFHLVTGISGNDAALNGSVFSEYIFGFAGSDTIDGKGGDDHVFGGAGNDNLIYTDGYDILDGGADVDLASFATFGSAVWVDLQFSGAEAWTRDGADLSSGAWRALADLANVEWIAASNFSDAIAGDNNSNQLMGLGGDDRLSGRDGDDLLFGGEGDDSLYGGAGADIIEGGAGVDFLEGGVNADKFVLASQAADWDLIQDFSEADSDTLVVSRALFGDFDNSGAVSPSSWFRANLTGAAEGAGDRFIYNTANGNLYFDVDGSGGSAGVLVAVLNGFPVLESTEFIVI